MKIANRFLSVFIVAMLLMTMFVSAEELPDEPLELLALSDAQIVAADKAAITSDSLRVFPLADGYLIDSLQLPTEGTNGSSITWATTNKKIIATDGTVTRHAVNDEEVTLTATYTSGSESDTEEFTFTVAALKTAVAGMPSLMGRLHADDFNDGIAGAGYISAPDSITESNGKMSVSSQNSETHVNLYAKPDKQETSPGNYFVEYNLTRENIDYVLVRLYGKADGATKNIAALRWNTGQYIMYHLNGSDSWVVAKGEYDYKFKMSFFLDFEEQTYTLWMNNELMLSDVPFRENCTSLSHNDIYFSAGNPNTLTFDSYATYIPWVDMSDEERVEADARELTKESFLTAPELHPGYIDADLKLSDYGVYGSLITWESSDESVISESGEVFRADDDEVRTAVLKATVKSGESETEKEFTFYVPGARLDIINEMTPIEYLVYEDFEDDDYQCTMIKNPYDATGTYGVSDGKYRLTRIDNSISRTYLRLTYGNPAYKEESPTGVFGIEFDISHDKHYGGVDLCDANGNYLMRISWRRGGVVYLYYPTEPNGDPDWRFTDYSVPNEEFELHFEILYDCRRGVASVWVNDKLVADDVYSNPPATSYYNTEFYISQENYGTLTVDNYKVYRAMPPTLKRLDYDLADFSLKSILNEETDRNFVTQDLNLMTNLYYGTEIEWSSSNPAVINPQTGEVNRPSAFEGNAPVTLTAKFKSYGREVIKTFDVIVLSTVTTSDEMLFADTDILTYELITDQNPDEIKTALNLMSKGVFGSDIVWKSSNTEAIAISGKVTRPRWNESDAPVTLTATIGGKNVKTFDFIVKAEEKLTDPQKVSDATFFGKYQNGSWSTTPLLDYDYPGMEEVGNAAQSGDYEKAKEELFKYMKGRTRKNVMTPAARNTQWVNALAAGIRDMQGGTHYRATSSIESSEYEKVSVFIKNPKVSENTSKSFRLIAKHNDPVEILVLGNTYPDESMRPKMVLNVNGVSRTYDAALASTVRCGEYMDTPHPDPSELKVKTFGEFLGNETYQTVFRFDFDDLSSTDTITYGEIVFYAKKSNPYSEPKEFYVMGDNNSTWDQENVTWNDLLTVLHNYNGLEGDIDWYKVPRADIEFLYQSCRFFGYPEMMSEYIYTGDEYYAYTIIKRIMDFTIDCSAFWTRTLDIGCRMDSWVAVFEGLLDSPYMDADICTTIMKAMYQTCADSLYYHNEKGNWTQTEKTAMYHVFTLFPEFERSEELRRHVTDFYLNQVKEDFLPDGTYYEDTEGYNKGAYMSYVDMKRNIMNSGDTVPEEYDEYILKGAYAYASLRGPSGEVMGYGDQGHTSSMAYSQLSEITAWFGDRELEYIDTFGKKGIEPEWKSILYPSSTYAFMRNNWLQTCNYLFTQVRGYIGAHGHADDNSYILYSNGRCLLVDAGFVTYSDNSDRAAAIGVRNHNTVEIDGKNQNSPGVYNDPANIGTTHYWTTNDEYDFLSQTSRAYETIGNKHKRTTTFIKDDFVICSDYFEPTEKVNEHIYRQSWHTPHDSETSFEFENGTFKTNYLTGANLMVLNADEDAVLLEGAGCWSNGYGNPIYIPYGYYEKTAVGDATLDTVLIPGEGSFDASVERLDTGVPTTVATALKIETNHSGVSEVYYYLLNYETTRTEKTFGKYKSDAQMVVVNEDEEGNITRIMLNGGTYVKNAAGEVIFKVDGGVSDVSVSVENAICTIETSEAALDAEKIFFDFGQKVTALKICDAWKDFTQTGTAVGVLNGAGVSMDKTDNNQDIGIIDKPNAGGNAPGTDTPGVGGAGGGGGGGGAVTPGAAYPFADIQSHWGSEYIIKAYEKNIISGYEDNTFRPDEKITRAEFITLICRSFNIEKAEYNAEFEDVKEGDWYAENIASAMKAGLISKDTNFRPNDSITREEMSKIIAIAIEKFAQAEEIPAEWKNDFVDNDDISDWAKEYIDFVNYNKFILGREDGSFAPKANTTRAEAATVIVRIGIINSR